MSLKKGATEEERAAFRARRRKWYQGRATENNELKRKYRLAHKDKVRKYRLAYKLKNPEYERKYKLAHRDEIREHYRKYYQEHRLDLYAKIHGPCPACGTLMCTKFGSIVCRSCLHFLNWRDGRVKRADIEKAISTITREDKEKWKAVKTQKEAMLLRKQLLKTLQSQTSGKNRDLSASLPKDSPQRTQRK